MKHKYPILVSSNRQEVDFLVQKCWLPHGQKITLSIDSYQDGVLQGRIYSSDSREHHFDSLSRFLVIMETILEENPLPGCPSIPHTGCTRKGNCATFELQILFRQHSSWQGVIFWKEQRRRQNFRSVLELITLIGSALQLPDGREAV